MQTLSAGTYGALWGVFQVTLWSSGDTWRWSVASSDAPDKPLATGEEWCATSAAAIRQAARVLEDRGCAALVNGRPRPLEAFLFFEKSTVRCKNFAVLGARCIQGCVEGQRCLVCAEV